MHDEMCLMFFISKLHDGFQSSVVLEGGVHAKTCQADLILEHNPCFTENVN